MPSRRSGHLAMPKEALSDDPMLVRVAPMTATRRIRGGKDFNLGCAFKVGHKVGLNSRPRHASGGPRRKVTLEIACASPRWRAQHICGERPTEGKFAQSFMALIEADITRDPAPAT